MKIFVSIMLAALMIFLLVASCSTPVKAQSTSEDPVFSICYTTVLPPEDCYDVLKLNPIYLPIVMR